MSDLPTLDFAKFMKGPDWMRKEVATKITDSFIKHGFVKIINHGISNEMVDGIFSWGAKFFHLKPEQKDKCTHIPSADPQRGWSHMRAETTSKLWEGNSVGAPKGVTLTDEKEHFDCGPADDAQFPNLWPDPNDLPGFQEFMESYFVAAQEIGLNVMEACEVGLDLPQGTLVDRCTPAASELRMNHYPAVSIETLKKGITKRTWPHSDFGIITLLFQDAVGGLELEDRANPGTFVPVIRKDPHEMVINISDTFQRWSNNVIRVGLHQVTNPVHMKGMEEGELPERYSSVFFMKAHRQTSVGPLPQFVGPDRPARYSDITALEFHQQMTDILY